MIDRLKWNRHSLALGMAMFSLFAAMPCAHGFTLFESATLGPTGPTPGGLEVSSLQFVGVRFQVSQMATTSVVGGHLYETPFQPLGNHQIFGALVELSGPNDVPDSFDLSTPDVLSTTLLTLSPLSGDVSAPLSETLTAGWYTLIFGSGLFGATGHGDLHPNLDPAGMLGIGLLR
jgi:hypothetical protein